MLRILLAAAALAASVAVAHAAPPQLHPVTLTNGELGGDGATIIRRELPSAQFILWGEDHGLADSPLLLRAIARAARSHGFAYHVVEVGPLSIRLAENALARGGVPGLAKLVHAVPLGLPFLANKEDAELASDFLGHDAKGQPYLIGVDQEFIGAPSFHLKRLVEIAPNEAARAEAARLLAAEEDASAKAAQDKFLLMTASEADFDKLAGLFKGNAEGERIVAELKESAAIYQLWTHGRNYENNARRARLLAKNFLAAYHAAAVPEPRMIFKMGLEHVALGTNSNNVTDLGTLATSIARTNGHTALRIAYLPAGGQVLSLTPKPGNPTAVQPYEGKEAAEVLTAIGVDPKALPPGWSLISMEEVRQALDTRGLDKLPAFARLLVLGYDYLITTPDAKPATYLY